MKDFLGRELFLGDTVVLTRPNYREFVKAKIIKFTPKKVKVEYVHHFDKSFIATYMSEPDFLIKVIENVE